MNAMPPRKNSRCHDEHGGDDVEHEAVSEIAFGVSRDSMRPVADHLAPLARRGAPPPGRASGVVVLAIRPCRPERRPRPRAGRGASAAARRRRRARGRGAEDGVGEEVVAGGDDHEQ